MPVLIFPQLLDKNICSHFPQLLGRNTCLIFPHILYRNTCSHFPHLLGRNTSSPFTDASVVRIFSLFFCLILFVIAVLIECLSIFSICQFHIFYYSELLENILNYCCSSRCCTRYCRIYYTKWILVYIPKGKYSLTSKTKGFTFNVIMVAIIG